MEADLSSCRKKAIILPAGWDDLAVQRPLRQTRTRKPPPGITSRDEKTVAAGERHAARKCGGALSYPGEDAAEQNGADAQRLPGYPQYEACPYQCDAIVQAPAPHGPSSGYRRTGAAGSAC